MVDAGNGSRSAPLKLITGSRSVVKPLPRSSRRTDGKVTERHVAAPSANFGPTPPELAREALSPAGTSGPCVLEHS